MGCFSSKHAAGAASSSVFVHPADNNNGSAIILEPHLLKKNRSGKFDLDSNHDSKSTKEKRSPDRGRDLKKSRKESSHSHSLSHSHLHSNTKGSFSFKIGFSQRYVQAEQTAAGWPTWLSSVAGDAIIGWVPLRADSFEKLEKIGQGTYSSVFRAREVETGRMVALKKVRVDNFQPESIRFMAREIMILRRLDHPNIVKLEGLITSRLSSSIYLVFEYMEHDLSGLISSPDVKFSEAQVKCYMTQLLCGIEHCHLRGIMHRDIKASNILVNNEGILKLGDFGLANIISPKNRQPLTSRVVTLWYRPPELLMGSTDYGVSVDLWSVGCVFAELLIGKPILKGRTEVEQLHKIFKLCGSPPDEFWKKSELPHAAMFKPLHNYESSIGEKCKDFPTTAVKLIETLLSIEPQKRGTASSALMSEYFNTQPFACDPSSLPKYPPSKEIDAKNREDGRRKKSGAKVREPAASRKPRRPRKTLQETNCISKLAPKEKMQDSTQLADSNNDIYAHTPNGKDGFVRRAPLKLSFDTQSETSQVMDASQGDSTFSGPTEVSASSGFAWAKRQKADAASTISDGSKSKISALDPSFAKSSYITKKESDLLSRVLFNSIETAKHEMKKQQHQLDRPDSSEASDAFHSPDVSMTFRQKEETGALTNNAGYKSRGEHIEFSGPLLSQPSKFDELLQKNESHIRQADRRSRFERD
ncbi:protein IMPAIRED IN BABA-INDUCED STERILITY 1-like [Juglans microcarpa x Juglans regia]|uniref:protein IMPAIRED IN BABA-INDUCED STERILITY 1-like n=1 Tax=Juglans microcarpa x Juglans regia TaxID=2249226 RepID=UPI001B7F3A1C|nr:protein IMPAIRED IN BABA-INDUCED STERILITY 1-like [Juglans microcarpa x Juglans regia]